jgi:hypothetical protein
MGSSPFENVNREGRKDGALALADLRLLLNQPPRKLGGSYFCEMSRDVPLRLSVNRCTLPAPPLTDIQLPRSAHKAVSNDQFKVQSHKKQWHLFTCMRSVACMAPRDVILTRQRHDCRK